MNAHSLVRLAPALVVAACVSFPQPPPGPVDLDTITVGRITVIVDDGVLRLNEDLDHSIPRVLPDEVRQELDLCATGAYQLDLHIRITSFSVDAPDWPMHKVEGVHSMIGSASLVRSSGEVVATRDIQAQLPSAASMRELRWEQPASRVGAEAFGRAVCRGFFGRNPRSQDPQRNATPE